MRGADRGRSMSGPGRLGPGGLLRSASGFGASARRRGFSLDDVAGRTRIPIRHLQHIEREEWDALPAPTYAVGFTRNYANAVGLDGADAGARAARADRRPQPARRRRPNIMPRPIRPACRPARWSSRRSSSRILIGAYLVWRSTLDEGPRAVPPLDTHAAPAPAPAQPAQTGTAKPAGRRRPARHPGRDRRRLAADQRRARRRVPLPGHHGRRPDRYQSPRPPSIR